MEKSRKNGSGEEKRKEKAKAKRDEVRVLGRVRDESGVKVGRRQ